MWVTPAVIFCQDRGNVALECLKTRIVDIYGLGRHPFGTLRYLKASCNFSQFMPVIPGSPVNNINALCCKMEIWRHNTCLTIQFEERSIPGTRSSIFYLFLAYLWYFVILPLLGKSPPRPKITIHISELHNAREKYEKNPTKISELTFYLHCIRFVQHWNQNRVKLLKFDQMSSGESNPEDFSNQFHSFSLIFSLGRTLALVRGTLVFLLPYR